MRKLRTNTPRATSRGISLLLVGLAAVFLFVLIPILGRASGGDAPVALPSTGEAEASRPQVEDRGEGRRPVATTAFLREKPGATVVVSETRSEREHLRFLRELAQERPEAFLETVERTLREAGPNAEKVAVLRALYENRRARTEELFLLALALPDTSTRHGESVPSFAVHYLGERADRDPLARSILQAIVVRKDPPAMPPGPRRRAAIRLAETGTESDLEVLKAVLRVETDSLLIEGVLVALKDRSESLTAEAILREHRSSLLVSDQTAVRSTTNEQGMNNR